MFLDKETYERAGLVGKPHGVKGKRGLKPRWGTCTCVEVFKFCVYGY
jgi:ribonuclease P/MRP protein subunit RPP40